MSVGTKVDLGACHVVLDGDPAPPPKKRGTAPNFRPMSIVAKRSPISAAAELLYIIWMHILQESVLQLSISACCLHVTTFYCVHVTTLYYVRGLYILAVHWDFL